MEQFDLIKERLNCELEEMNRIISETLHTHNELMDRIVTNYLTTKGKQIRPIMVLLSAKLFGGSNSHTLQAGAALEMLHNASLIHDDVIDEATLRRNAKTINSEWDNRIAVLVGDFFVSNALAASIKTDNIQIIKGISNLGKELSLGEIDQICNVRDKRLDEESYFQMIREKTASLFRNCVKMGADTAGATDEESAAAVDFAELLGLCFQIKDDIFDYFNDASIGKPTGNDLREGKVTLPLLYALRTADKKKSDEMHSLLAKDTLSENDIQRLITFAIENGGINYAYDVMHDMLEKGKKLMDVYPDSIWKESFIDIFEYIISRSK